MALPDGEPRFFLAGDAFARDEEAQMEDADDRLVHVARAGSRFGRRLRVVAGNVAGAPERRQISVLLLAESGCERDGLDACLAAVAGYHLDVTHAASAEEALKRGREQNFDLCLCDFWLGAATAMPFLEQAGRYPGRPVVLLSSLESDDIELLSRRAGVSGLLQRADLTPQRLEAVLDTLFDDGVARPAERPLADWLRGLLGAIERIEASTDAEVAIDPVFAELLADVTAEADGLKQTILAALFDLQNPAARPTAPLTFDVVAQLDAAVARLRASGTAVDYRAPELPILITTRLETVADCLQALLAEAEAAAVPVRVQPLLRAGFLDLFLEVSGPRAGVGPLQAAIVAARRDLTAGLAAAAGGAFDVSEDEGALRARLRLPLRPRDAARP